MKVLKSLLFGAALSGAALIGLAGCSAPRQEAIIMHMPEAKGYDVVVEKDVDHEYGNTRMRIGRYDKVSKEFSQGIVIGLDYGNDERIDVITLHGIPKGNELEEMANVKDLDEILKAASKHLK
jgi:hypothetical protein